MRTQVHRILPRGLNARARAGLSLTAAVSLVSVVFVLVLVSLPRLRAFVLVENAQDARITVRLLAEEYAALETMEAEPRIATLFEKSSNLRHILSDAESLEGGRLLRRHGYLFAFVPRVLIERDEESEEREAVRLLEANVQRAEEPHWILGWPWGEETTALYLANPGGGLYSLQHTHSSWSGPGLDPLALPPLRIWERLSP